MNIENALSEIIDGKEIGTLIGWLSFVGRSKSRSKRKNGEIYYCFQS
jgi:hypothetical protein